jgi:hypothetical protein
MSYINRLIGDGALYAVTYNGAIKNYVNSVTPTLTGCRTVDPLTSTSGDAILVPNTATNSLSIPSPFTIADTQKSFAVELVFHINPVSSDTVIAAFSGAAGTFLTAQSNSRLNINLPISGYGARDVTVTCFYDQAHHLVVNISPGNISVFLDSREVANFAPADKWVLTSTQNYLELANLVFANTTTAFTIDTVSFYSKALTKNIVLKHYLAAFLSPDPDSAVNFQFSTTTTENTHRVWNMVGEQQDYAYRLHSPVTTPWDEWTRDNTSYYDKSIGINIYNRQGYDSTVNAYYIENLGDLIKAKTGTIHFNLTSYSTTNHPSRGLFFLANYGSYEYEMRMSAANVPTFTIYTPTYDGSNILTGYTSQDYTLTTATNGQPLNVGIVWDSTQIKVVFANAVQHTITHSINAQKYKMYFGTGRSSVAAGNTTQSILTGSGIYNMRIWDTNNYLASTDIMRGYGKYTFSSADAAKYKVPVYADATASIEMPLGYSDDVTGSGSSTPVISYNMQQFIDGPVGLITEPVP